MPEPLQDPLLADPPDGSALLVCADCGDEITEDEAFPGPQDDIIRCESCHSDIWSTCYHCGCDVRRNDLNSVNGGDEAVCDRCLSAHYRTCCDCGEDASDTSRALGGDRVCGNCRDNGEWHYCDGCNRYCSEDDYAGDDRCVNCAPSEDDEDEDQSSDVILPYHSKSATRALGFFGTPTDKTWFGVELEMECQTHDRQECAEDALLAIGSDFATCQNDSSLSNGFELITAPATMKHHMERFGRFFDAFDLAMKNRTALGHCRSWTTGNCGLHIHFSREGLTPLQLGKLLVFINSEDNSRLVTTVAGRDNHGMAGRSPKKIKDGRGTENFNRYEAVNTTNSSTIEFRIFRGTLKRATFFKALEFVASAIAFVRWTGCSNLGQADYLGWVAPQGKTYPHLVKFLRAREFLPALKPKPNTITPSPLPEL